MGTPLSQVFIGNIFMTIGINVVPMDNPPSACCATLILVIGPKIYDNTHISKRFVGLDPNPFHKHFDTIDIQVKKRCYSKFGIDSFGHLGCFVDTADVQILPDFVHDNRIRQVVNPDTQLLGHILFGCINSHASVQLHTRYQISGSS